MSTAFTLPVYTPAAPLLTKHFSPRTSSFFSSASFPCSSRQTCGSSRVMTCRASASAAASSITDFDLYDLLGIDNTSDQAQIKMAYRTLQKRCHPDIAGPAGHDMAIILNEAYSVLSDPSLRLAYDKEKEQAKTAELRGYTGKPIYSVWFGSEGESRAVFVDEVKCVGCLKCALFAEKTFAIESAYGRARVVAQWADPEHNIQAAIDSCPVDCISVVERSDLAALEFLMSKQPRGRVRVGAGNAVGARVSNIFIDVKKFQTRFSEASDKANAQSSRETDLQRESRMSAIHAIRSISNWLMYQNIPVSSRNLTRVARKSTQPNINKIREAAAARKLAGRSSSTRGTRTKNHIYHEEYWIPSTQALPPASSSTSSSASAPRTEALDDKETKSAEELDYREGKNDRRQRPAEWRIPVATAIVAAVIVGLHAGEGAVGGVNEHVGGYLALEVVNSYWLQVTLAGITWYAIAVATVELVEAIRHR